MKMEHSREIIYAALSKLLKRTAKHEDEHGWSKIVKNDIDGYLVTYNCVSDIWTMWKIEISEGDGEKTTVTIYTRSEDAYAPFYTNQFCKIISTDDVENDIEMKNLIENLVTEVTKQAREYILSDNGHAILSNYIDCGTLEKIRSGQTHQKQENTNEPYWKTEDTYSYLTKDYTAPSFGDDRYIGDELPF